MSRSIEELIEQEQKAHRERVAALRKKQQEQDERIDREVLRWLKKEQPEKWAELREAAEQRLAHKRERRSRLAQKVHERRALGTDHGQDDNGGY